MSRTETVEPAYPHIVANEASGECVVIGFSSIVKQMPQELQGKNSPSGSAKFALDVNRVLEQVAFGAVRVPFKELRRHAPAGVFVTNHTHDEKLIDLPLREIIPQLKPEYLARRQQVRLEAPEDGTELFNRTGRPVGPLRVIAKDELLKTEEKPAAPEPPATRASQTPKPAPTTPTGQPSAPIVFPGAQPIAARSAPAAQPQPQPQAPLRIPTPRVPTQQAPAAPISAPRLPGAQAPTAPVAAPRLPTAPAAPIGAPRLPTAPAPAPQVVAPRIPAPKSTAPEEALSVPLEQLSEQWPDEIHDIIDSWGAANFQCLLPMSNLGAALKSGAARFTLQELRGWIKPTPPADEDGIYDETVLDLPLKVLAPLYMAKARGAAQQKKMDVGQHIPDVFSKEGVVGQEVEEEEEEVEVLPSDSGTEATEPLLSVSLSILSQKWPDALRKEIALLRLTDAKVELPLETIEAALKVGKFECYWKQVCHWLKPCPTAALASVHADLRLDLPLNLIAPLYLKQRSGPDATPTAGGAGVEPQVQPRNLGELFNEPDKRSWTPNEIVHKTSELPGVAGALMALQDGLLVASCMPPEWKSETVAAFMPQIFGRMKQYTKELKMGELDNISICVEQGTFQIFNVGIIYFAALAKPNSTLPQESLKLIVRELARHTR
jgi:predicted regulator of Ras-like GTPase activity (Roadblock/LC7/MglB family)